MNVFVIRGTELEKEAFQWRVSQKLTPCRENDLPGSNKCTHQNHPYNNQTLPAVQSIHKASYSKFLIPFKSKRTCEPHWERQSVEAGYNLNRTTLKTMTREIIFLKWELKTPHVLHPSPPHRPHQNRPRITTNVFQSTSTDDLPGI